MIVYGEVQGRPRRQIADAIVCLHVRLCRITVVCREKEERKKRRGKRQIACMHAQKSGLIYVDERKRVKDRMHFGWMQNEENKESYTVVR